MREHDHSGPGMRRCGRTNLAWLRPATSAPALAASLTIRADGSSYHHRRLLLPWPAAPDGIADNSWRSNAGRVPPALAVRRLVSTVPQEGSQICAECL